MTDLTAYRCAALTGLLAHGDLYEHGWQSVVTEACQIADDMLARSAEQPEASPRKPEYSKGWRKRDAAYLLGCANSIERTFSMRDDAERLRAIADRIDPPSESEQPKPAEAAIRERGC